MIERRKPLKRSTKPLKRSPIVRKPPRKKSPQQKQSALARRKSNPYSTYWRDKADALWSFLVRHRAKGYCQHSGYPAGYDRLNAHHLIRRARCMTRHSLENGFAIWQIYHRRDYTLGPHGASAWQFDRKLKKMHPDKAAWMDEHKDDKGRACWRDNYVKLIEAAAGMGCLDEVRKRKL